jgi:hypothetical protein
MGEMVVEPEGFGAPPKACACLSGDPLCSCLDRPYAPAAPFDRNAVAAAVDVASEAVLRSVRPRETSFHVRLEFLRTGHVGNVTIDEPGDLSDKERTQVTRVLRGMRVPAFDGSPVTLGRTFEIHPKSP